jgi:hypothetical protein
VVPGSNKNTRCSGYGCATRRIYCISAASNARLASVGRISGHEKVWLSIGIRLVIPFSCSENLSLPFCRPSEDFSDRGRV